MTSIQDQIAAAKERLAKLEAKAQEPPKRPKKRPEEQVQQIMALEGELRREYGCGYAGLAEIVRKGKRDGVVASAPTQTSVGHDEPEGYIVESRILEPGEERRPEALLTRVEAPREHHGDGDEPLPVQPDPIWDPSDEPPIENTPELAAAQQPEEAPPW